MRKRSGNKGFSLVEIIVVVLIMAIIAVTLAPQVMKWAEKARESADFQAADDLKAMAQVAVAEFESKSNAPAVQDEDYNILSSGVAPASGADTMNPGMTAILEYYMNGTYPLVQNQIDKIFQIQIKDGGQKIAVEIIDGTY